MICNGWIHVFEQLLHNNMLGRQLIKSPPPPPKKEAYIPRLMVFLNQKSSCVHVLPQTLQPSVRLDLSVSQNKGEINKFLSTRLLINL